MRYDLIIFDMDGTILDTLEDLKESVNYALRHAGYPERTLDEVRGFVGNGIRNLIIRSVPCGTAEQQIEDVHGYFTEHYTVHCSDHTKPYRGIPELLVNLRRAGCKTAVVSNKADYAVQALCRQYFENQFDMAAGEQMPHYQKKPAPDLVNLIREKLDVSCSRAVYIGDSDVDIETAHNAQMDCITVDWGFRDRDFLISHGAEVIVSDAEELERILLD